MVVWDIKKWYNALLTGDIEAHCQILFWRWEEEDHPWEIYVFTTVHFGDNPSTVLWDKEGLWAPQEFQHIDKDLCMTLVRVGYAEDMMAGGMFHFT